MKEIAFLTPAPVFIEITPARLQALCEGDGLEIPLEREADGKIKTLCQEKVIARLQAFAGRKFWQTRPRAFCALSANGVLLRRLSLPAAGPEQFRKLLLLQIESEFPLPPAELAWGFSKLHSAAGKQDVLVAAVKKTAVAEYASLFAACGFDPVFTVAALARNALSPQPAGSHAWLEIETGRAELVVFTDGVPAGLRVLLAASESALAAAVAKALGTSWPGKKVFVTGTPQNISAPLAAGLEMVPVKLEAGPGRSAANLGLQKILAGNGGPLPLTLQVQAKSTPGKLNLSKPEIKIWLQRAAVLLAALLLLPYAEPLLANHFLVKRLARLQADQERLVTIDRELDFLENLKQTQPPYLDACYLFAKSAPPGARLESLTLNRRGEVSLRGTMQNGQLVTEFRSKLIASGFFASVSVEEQTPTPDRQKVNVRITAQWKPASALAGLALGPSAEEIERAKTNKTAAAEGGAPPGMFPMMPGAMLRSRPARN